jgi:hypothetical protein
VFEKIRARRAAAEAQHEEAAAAEASQQQLAAWQAERDGVEELLAVAKAPGTAPDGLVLHRGELCFGVLTSCSLVEERKGAGHFVGGSTGVSIPIGSLRGRSVRYRVGTTRGHYVAGQPEPTAVAEGTLYLTNQRLVFLSATQTRECRFDRLVGIQADDSSGQLFVSVSNRQHPTVIAYGAAAAPWVAFHIDLCLAQWRGDVDQLVAGLDSQLAEIDARRPATP